MANLLWCWRCQMEIPMLKDDEAEYVLQPMVGGPADVEAALKEVAARYFKITGSLETNPVAIFHHVISQYGPPCATCGKPLRTPRAKMCASCGTVVAP